MIRFYYVVIYTNAKVYLRGFFPLCNCSECSFSRGISAEDVFMKDGDRMSGGTLSL